jgi:threonine dehydrogenase-like Zn-dependent dehydrogenase
VEWDAEITEAVTNERIDSARVLGAAQVIAIDREPYRLRMAEEAGHATINFEKVDVRSRLLELTGGRGPDKCIDAAGMEASHGSGHIHAYDRIKQAIRSGTERPHALRQAIMACRSGGVVSVIGVYGGFLEAPHGFDIFKHKQDNCEKVVLKP